MQEFDDAALETMAAGPYRVPLLRLLGLELPETEIKVGVVVYTYDCSYPIRGFGAAMPKRLAELQAAGRKPLVAERPTRYYVYSAEASPTTAG